MRHDPDSNPRAGAHLWLLGRTLAVLALVLLPVAATRAGCVDHRPGAPRDNLARALRARTGLAVDAADVALLPPRTPGLLATQEVLFLGRAGAAAPRDLYLARARLAAGGVPVSLAGPWNLSRTADADEEALQARGRFAACASRLAGHVETVVVYDLAGERPELTAGWPAGERLLDRLTNLQETGALAGVGRASLELTPAPAAVALAFPDPGRLEVRPRRGPRVVYDVAAGAVVAGADTVRVTPMAKGRRSSYVTWAVDTVRNLSFVGPERIAALERLVFKYVDHLQVIGAKVTKSDGHAAIVEDLDFDLPPPASAPAAAAVPGWPPGDLAPLLQPPLPGEGHWVLLQDPYTPRQPGLPPVFAETFLRVDRERPFSRVYLVAWDPRRLELHLVPGTTDPVSASGKPGSGRIPRDGPDRARLAAAFSGGWQTIHGHFGMRAQGTTIVSPAGGLATFGRLRDGATAFGTWPKGLRKTPPEVAEFRQNLYPLFEHGVLNPGGHSYWGGAHSSELELNHIRRSALCATRAGQVVFFYGENVSIYTLSQAMQTAGCDYGLELDINRPNVSFELYRVIPRSALSAQDPPLTVHERRSRAAGVMPGRKELVYFVRSLVRGQGLGGFPRYINATPRDFVYLTLRELLPGPDLAVPLEPRLPGEGVWQTAGLPQGPDPFPAAIATTTVRPDPSRPELSVRLLAVDTRRVDLAVAPAPPAGAVLAAVHLGGPGRTQTLAPGDAPAAGPALLIEGGGDQAPRVVAGALVSRRVTRPAVRLAGTPLAGDAAAPAAPAPAAGPAPAAPRAARPAHAATTVASCSRGPFLLVAQVGGDEPAAAARALALAGCSAAVRLGSPGASPHVVVRGVDRQHLAPGERALWVVAHSRPSLVPMFAPQPTDDLAAPRKKIDGEAILKRALLRHKPE